MKRLIINIALLMLFASSVFGQKTIKEYVDDGKLFMEEGKFYAAAQSFEKALRFDTTNAEISYLYAQSLSKSLNYSKAIKWYNTTLSNADTAKYPMAIFEMAMAMKNCGDYKNALTNLNQAVFISHKHPSLSKIYDRILHEITSLEFALNHVNDSIKFYIQQLPTTINTTNSEFNPVPLPGNKLVFSSYKTLYSDTFSNIFSTFYTSNIMESSLIPSGWTETISFDNQINSNKWFTANICFGANYQTAYFTRCYDNNGLIGRCQIYKSSKDNGHWSKPEKLPTFINSDEFSATQPFFVDGDEFDILYFVSNMPGGYGGMDIWYSILKEGRFQTPSNLGNVINTIGNEITPNFDSKTNQLYFSSDWHEGFGSYDIFISLGGLNQWSKPVNMGIPINSENNDLYFTPIPNTNEAYLSSNRIGSFSQPGADHCCNDIYMVTSEKTIHPPVPIDTIPISPPNTIENKIKQLLPITLYFDNDMPDPKTWSDTTLTNYKTLLNLYVSQKETYQKKYSEGLTGREQLAAMDSITAFFDNQVLMGFEKLSGFIALLRQEIDSGKTVSIVIKGFASPLNTPEYNYQLSKRRIASLINYVSSVDSGYFLPYLLENDSIKKRLNIFEDPRGDKNSALYVSKNPNDQRNSVYSKAAALERRIQIALYSSSEANYTEQAMPTIKLKLISKDKELVNKGEIIKGSFELSNEGNTELLLLGFDTGCEYIQFEPNKFKIKSKEKTKVYFLIKTGNLNSGPNKIVVKTKSNASEEKEMTIEFKVN